MTLQLLFQIILLLCPSIALAQSPALRNCQSICGNVTIPFPFGIGANCYIDDWFEITCSNNKPFLRKMKEEVLEISLDGTMRVNHPIFKYCTKKIDPHADDADYSSKLFGDLQKSTFVFSPTRNRFTALGCNNLAYMITLDESVLGGCLSICDEKIKRGEKGCYGRECCQTTIPSSVKTFNATVSSINYEKTTKNRCKYAFLVEQQWFQTNYLTRPQDVKNKGHVPVVLDWGISNDTFNLFKKHKRPSDHYKSTSSCKVFTNITTNITSNSTNYQIPIVRCDCKKGFQGNPYLLQGCQDIDECKRNSHICGKMTCVNNEGHYDCFSASNKKSKINALVLGFGTGIGSLFLIFGAWWLCIMIKRRKAIKLKEKFFKQNGGLLLKKQLISSNGGVDKGKLFSSEDLDKATDHFNMNRIVGQGGQGTVYKGMLPDGRIIAVKKAKVVDEGKIHDFINEVTILSQINHRNIVKLLGYCLETEVPLLVYEFIPNGTLFQYLHDQNEEVPFSWDKRLQIVAEIAGALSYLHSAASLPIYHRDIKSTNILLDEKYRAKIADFGTSRSIAIDQTHVTTRVQGTFGYLDPEYFRSSQFTDKSDVYSFGVVLVEILTGQKPVSSTRSEECKSLVVYFISYMEENRLNDILDSQILREGKKVDIVAVANLAKRCLNLNGKRRPSMKEVALELEGIRASSKDSNIQQTPQEIDYERSEVFEAWDVGSTSTTTFDKIGTSANVQ